MVVEEDGEECVAEVEEAVGVEGGSGGVEANEGVQSVGARI